MLLKKLLLEKINDTPLRPSSVITIRLGQESTVASMIRFNQGDLRIGLQLLARLWQNADKRIVLGMNHQRRHSNLVHHAGSRSAVVIIVSAAKSTIRRGNDLVEFADAARTPLQLAIDIRKQQPLAVIAPH